MAYALACKAVENTSLKGAKLREGIRMNDERANNANNNDASVSSNSSSTASALRGVLSAIGSISNSIGRVSANMFEKTEKEEVSEIPTTTLQD